MLIISPLFYLRSLRHEEHQYCIAVFDKMKGLSDSRGQCLKSDLLGSSLRVKDNLFGSSRTMLILVFVFSFLFRQIF